MGKKRTLILALSVTFIVVVLGLLYFSKDEKPPEKRDIRVQRENISDEADPVYLYFADAKSIYLEAENTYFSHSKEPVPFGKLILQTLAEGSIHNRARTLPEKTAVRSLFVDQEGTCYVDFESSIKETMKKGCYDEILAVYSIVNSLVINVPEISRVKILIGGQESETLAGHIDLSQPFKANMYLVR